MSLFATTPLQTTSGKKRADRNKLLDEDRAAHDWYRFVLSYPPHLVRDYVQKFELKRNQHVLDPFSGTGTTVVECKKLGLPGVGVEAHPMSFFAGQVKTDWTIDPDGLLAFSQAVARDVAGDFATSGIDDDEDCCDRVDPAELLTLPDSSHKLLLANSISPLPLHKVLVLLRRLRKHADDVYRRYGLLALAKGLTTSIGNLHFGPEVGVGPAKRDAPVLAAWLAGVQQMAADLVELRQLKWGDSTMYRADARQLSSVLPPDSIDAVITSPPYPNEKDYTRTTRLESVLLGFIQSRADLKAMKQGLMRSNTRNVYKNDDDDQWIHAHPQIARIADDIEATRIRLGKTSGFERMYARVTKLYFGGMARHFHELKPALKKGARLAYVVGDQASYLRVMIRTGQLLADIASHAGYEVIGIDLFRTRLATATRAQLREEVVLLRWPGEK